MAEADPTLAAVAFAARMRSLGFQLDFSLASLETEVDKLVESDLFHEGSNPESWAHEASLDAYIGEVLVRHFDGRWKGVWVDHHSGVNTYSSYIEFGTYTYRPSFFLGYLISNGKEDRGSFQQHLARVLPDIQRREQVE